MTAASNLTKFQSDILAIALLQDSRRDFTGQCTPPPHFKYTKYGSVFKKVCQYCCSLLYDTAIRRTIYDAVVNGGSVLKYFHLQNMQIFEKNVYFRQNY